MKPTVLFDNLTQAQALRFAIQHLEAAKDLCQRYQLEEFIDKHLEQQESAGAA